MTEQEALESTAKIPAQSTPPEPNPWADYLAAAQQLDSVRRAASSVAGKQQASVTAARQEQAGVRARLAPQHARLIGEFGLSIRDLTPQPAELAQAMQAVAGGPAAVLTALKSARKTADAADAAIIGGGPAPQRPLRPWARNLLVYGPFATAVLAVQLVLYLIAPTGTIPTYALLCGLSLPVFAFGLGWVTIGFVYGGDEGKPDRTPIVGVIACLTPVLLTCMGVGLLSLFR